EQSVGYEGLRPEVPQQLIEGCALGVIGATQEHRQAGLPGFRRQLAGRAQTAFMAGGGQNVKLDAHGQARCLVAVASKGPAGTGVPAGRAGLQAIQQILGQQRHRPAGSALVLAAADPGGAGDVQMRPVVVLGEARQEAAGSDGAGLRPTDVGDVGEGAVELLLILVEQRQLPGTVVGLFTGLEQLPDQSVVVAHQAGDVAAQGNDAGAGESGDVDYRLRLEAPGVGQGVAQYQAALSVGVEDFHGLPAHAGDDVAGARGAAAGHVLGTGQQAYQVDRQRKLQHGLEGAEYAGGAAHVVLHLVHAGGRLDADAAGIEGDALADQGE